MSRNRRAPIEKRRHATVSEVLQAVSKDAVVGLLMNRTVTAAVASESLEQLKKLMQNPRVELDPRVRPLVLHLRTEEAHGGQRVKLKATRKVGDILKQRSQQRPGGQSRTAVISLATLGNPDEYSVAYGADRIVITRVGEVSAADIATNTEPSPEDILKELENTTGTKLRAGGAS